MTTHMHVLIGSLPFDGVNPYFDRLSFMDGEIAMNSGFGRTTIVTHVAACLGPELAAALDPAGYWVALGCVVHPWGVSETTWWMSTCDGHLDVPWGCVPWESVLEGEDPDVHRDLLVR